ncbi:MAG TPA: tRNA lysidine(34) synthetase TilS [Chloroflexota bacterium]|nr:tRNA lysidine(34) synthetase TilS [Chloroflexota bacterium]
MSGAASDPTAPTTARVDRALRASLAALRAAGLGSGARVLVGLSGGQDSLALTHALWRLRAEHGWALHPVYVDHGLRAAGAAESAHLAALCADWGLPLVTLHLDVPAYRRQHRLNVQAAARYARYQALARLAAQLGADAVAVGHTADDVAETLLLHLLRGAGLDGLSAMPLVATLPLAALGPPLDAPAPPPSALRVVRPLLAVARADTLAYCAEQGLAPLVEAGRAYTRNRVRDEVLPCLERVQPGARQALMRAARALAEERTVVERAVEMEWRQRARLADAAVTLALAGWAELPAALQRRLIRRAVVALRGTAADLSQAVLDAALRVAAGESGRGIDLPHGLRLEREGPTLRLVARAPARAAEAASWPLPVPGGLVLPGWGCLRAEYAPPPPPDRWRAVAPFEGWLDAAAVRLPLRVRFRRPGDRFQPLGMAHAKRLQDFLVDSRVPRHQRARLPLVVADNGIVWVVGQRIAHWARLRPETTTALHLWAEPGMASSACPLPVQRLEVAP